LASTMSELKLLVICLEQPNNAGGWLKENVSEIAQIGGEIKIVSLVDERNSHVLEKEKSMYGYINGDTGGYGLKIVEVDKSSTVSREIREQIRDYKPRYVILAADEEDFCAEEVSAALVALDCFPRAVGASRTLLYRPPAVEEDLDTTEICQADKYIHSGRALARLLLLRAIDITSLSNFVIRASAMGSDLPIEHDVKNGILLRRQLCMDLLQRGSMWIDEEILYRPGNKYRDMGNIFGYLNSVKSALDNGIITGEDTEKILHNLSLEAQQAGLDRNEYRFVEQYLSNTGSLLKNISRPHYDEADSTSNEEISKKLPTNVKKMIGGAGNVGNYAQTENKLILQNQHAFKTTQFNFVILLDPYTNYLQEREQLLGLYRYLKLYGYNAKVLLTRKLTSPRGDTSFLNDIAIDYGDSKDIDSNTVSIYSETTDLRHVISEYRIRWHFNRRRLPGEENWDNQEMQYSYSRSIDPYFPVLDIPVHNLNALAVKSDDELLQKKKRLLLVGHGQVDDYLDRSDVLEINDLWPPTLQVLSEVASKAILLLSCDWLNPLNEKAILAGLPVVLYGEQFWPNGDHMEPGEHLSDGMLYSMDGNISYEQLKEATYKCTSYRMRYQQSLDSMTTTINNFISDINSYYAKSEIKDKKKLA